MYTKGGGHKKKYRAIDFSNSSFSGIVETIEYDPYRTAHIARVFSSTLNEHKYILAPEGLITGHFINLDQSSLKIFNKLHLGNSYKIGDLPLGSFIFNLPISLEKEAQVTRSAGTYSLLIARGVDFCKIRLPSGEYRLLDKKTRVILGIVSNGNHNEIVIGKAGRNRWLNKRPSVRGVL